jgi:hypothetical protein
MSDETNQSTDQQSNQLTDQLTDQPVDQSPVSQVGIVDGLIKDSDGKPSSSRFLILLWGIGVFGIWAYSSLKSSVLQPIPESVIVTLGVLVAGKTIQRFGE